MENKKNLVIFDTTIGSMNVGDEIIVESARKYLNPLENIMNVRNYSSRIPSFSFLNIKRDVRSAFVREADYKFVLGTNLLKSCMLHRINQLNINILNMKPYRNLVLFGVGSEIGRIYLDSYTKYLYKKTLSSEFIHSVRDERTKKILTDLGLKSINTGCPTLWELGKKKCENIPVKKANNVVFTLHFGKKDYVRDSELIRVIQENYNKIYFFPQSIEDISYLNTFDVNKEIHVLPSSFLAYKRLLEMSDLDYVGVRLHGGIYAMVKGKRVIIISVDERMRGMNRNNNLGCIDSDDINLLEKKVNSNFETKIRIDYDAIDLWLTQFNMRFDKANGSTKIVEDGFKHI